MRNQLINYITYASLIFTIQIVVAQIPIDNCGDCLLQSATKWCGRNYTQGQCVSQAQQCDDFYYDFFCPQIFLPFDASRLGFLPYYHREPFCNNTLTCQPEHAKYIKLDRSKREILLTVEGVTISILNALLILRGGHCNTTKAENVIFEIILGTLPGTIEHFVMSSYSLPCTQTEWKLLLQSDKGFLAYWTLGHPMPISLSLFTQNISLAIYDVELSLMLADMQPQYDPPPPILQVESPTSFSYSPFILNDRVDSSMQCCLKRHDYFQTCTTYSEFDTCKFRLVISLDLPEFVTFFMKYEEPSYKDPYPSHNFWLYMPPQILSLEPSVASDAGGTQVMVIGKGLWYDPLLQIKALVFNKTIDLIILNATHSYMLVPPAVPGKIFVNFTVTNGNYVDTPFTSLELEYVSHHVPSAPNWELYIFFGVCSGLIVVIVMASIIIYWRINRKGYTPLPDLHDFESLLLEPGNLKYGERLGEGSYGVVYHGKLKNFDVAIKQLKFKGPGQFTDFINEISTMSNLRHPNVILLMGLINSPTHLCIITEFMELGSLASIIRNPNWIIEQEHVRKMALHTCQGMAYLHCKHIIHRDLKCANLLVDSHWNIKVADFGIARMHDYTSDVTMTICGTPAWSAPEMLDTQHYSHKVDVYSFAICLWEMTSRNVPFKGLCPSQVICGVLFHDKRPEISDVIPPRFQSVMKLCWQKDPFVRPDFDYLVTYFIELKCPVPSSESPCSTT